MPQSLNLLTKKSISKTAELILRHEQPFAMNQIKVYSIRALPNQELSGAKSELPGETVGVCSFHRKCGQLPYNLLITHLRFTPRSLQVSLLVHFNK